MIGTPNCSWKEHFQIANPSHCNVRDRRQVGSILGTNGAGSVVGYCEPSNKKSDKNRLQHEESAKYPHSVTGGVESDYQDCLLPTKSFGCFQDSLERTGRLTSANVAFHFLHLSPSANTSTPTRSSGRNSGAVPPRCPYSHRWNPCNAFNTCTASHHDVLAVLENPLENERRQSPRLRTSATASS